MIFGRNKSTVKNLAIFDVLLKTNHELIALISETGYLISFNDAFKNFIRKTTGKELKNGNNFYSYFPDSKQIFYRELIQKVIQTGHQIEFETEYGPDAHEVYYKVLLEPVLSKESKVTGIVLFAHDISDLRNAKKRLYEERERLSVTLQSIGEGVIVTDTDNTIIYFNNAAIDITGYSDTEMITKKVHDLFIFPAPVTSLHKNSEPIPARIRLRDGSFTPIEFTRNNIHDNNRQIIGDIIVFNDISARIKAEEEIIKKSKLDSLGLLAGGLAHDYNNLLTAILGNITLIKELTNDPAILDSISQAENAALQASELTQKLITFSKGGEPVKSIFKITDFIRETADFYMRGSNVKVIYNLDVNIPEFSGDKNQLSQAFNNILINAKQAMPEGGTITISAESSDSSKDEKLRDFGQKKFILIRISDEGTGIADSIISRIFDPYFTTKPNSLGLGLSSAYSIIKRHSGMITAHNNRQKGALISIYLPECDIIQQTDNLKIQKHAHSPASGAHILIMDDEKIIRDTLSGMLTQLGYRVTTANEGITAVELYKKLMNSPDKFSLVMLDLTIPGGMGGKQAIEQLLAIDPEVTAVVTSGYYDDPVIALSANYGFKGVLKKPYTFEELANLMKKLGTFI